MMCALCLSSVVLCRLDSQENGPDLASVQLLPFQKQMCPAVLWSASASIASWVFWPFCCILLSAQHFHFQVIWVAVSSMLSVKFLLPFGDRDYLRLYFVC